MNTQALLQITPGVCEAPLVLVALHRAQLLPEESVLGLDTLGTAFATPRRQSPPELCVAVIAVAAPAFASDAAVHSWDRIPWKSDFSGVCE